MNGLETIINIPYFTKDFSFGENDDWNKQKNNCYNRRQL
jgi:hypothetical protein